MAREWIGVTERALLRVAGERLGLGAERQSVQYAEILAELDGQSPSFTHIAEALQYISEGPIESVLSHALAQHHEMCRTHGLDPDVKYYEASTIERLTSLLPLGG